MQRSFQQVVSIIVIVQGMASHQNLTFDNLYYFTDNIVDFFFYEAANSVQNDMAICSENPVRSYIAGLLQVSCFNVIIFDSD